MVETLRRRSDFLAARNDGIKVGGPLIGLQMRDRGAPDERPRVGFTVTKRVGGAVERNRMKRRLRAAARACLAPTAMAGCDYVLVARRAVLDAPFERLVRDVGEAVRRAHGKAGVGKAAAGTDKGSGSPPPGAADRRESGR